jgi:hypothetical protein
MPIDINPTSSDGNGQYALPLARDWQAYRPVLAMTLVSVLVAHVLKASYAAPFMTTFMGLWLVQFALVKLFDLDGFVDKFARYDLVTKRVRAYGYAFPFIELVLGLAFLGGYYPLATHAVLLIVATVTLVGVFLQLKNKDVMHCACMGSTIKVPLSEVALIENALMIVMALSFFLTHKIF